MEYDIKLLKNKGYSWTGNGTCYVKGYAWIDNICYQEKDLLLLFNNCENITRFLGLVKKMNGIFAGIWQDGTDTYLISDSVCVFPLFYSQEQGIITDDAYELAKKLKVPQYDALCIADTVASAAHSCGDKTWYQDIRQTIAGEILRLPRNGNCAVHFSYYDHALYGMNRKQKMENYFKDLNQLSQEVFQRVIAVLNGRTAIIPLSGGCDSRYIAVMLSQLGYKNVVCFTYGKKDSFEVQNSKKIAQILGYPHFFIEYTSKLLEMYVGQEIWCYKKYATRLSNLVHVQDYIALKELINNPDFPKHGVIVPGHSGDMYGGTHDFTESTNQEIWTDQLLAKAIYNEKYSGLKFEQRYKNFILDDILMILKGYGEEVDDIKQVNSKNNFFDISYRQAQFICNSLRIYDYFGYSYVLPFYDLAMEQYWCDIPMEYRQIPSLYHTYLLKYLFPKYGLCFISDEAYLKGKRNNGVLGRKQKWKQNIHVILEYFLMRYNVNLRFWNPDVNNLAAIQQKLYHSITNKNVISLKHSDFNHLSTIRDMEYLLQDKYMMRNILGK